MRALLLAVVCSCSYVDIATSADGEVYQCESLDASAEYCYLADSADDLASQLGDDWSCAPTERWWPRLTNAIGKGCVYQCPGVKGANAKNGAFCP